MTLENSTDFCVVASKSPSASFKHNVIQTKLNSNYIGCLKYFPKLPDYDQYVYLDSDILFFGSPDNLINKNTAFSVVCEKEGKLTDEWHSFHLLNKALIPNTYGLNAGTFAFKNKQFLNEMVKLLETHYNPYYDPHTNAKLEQSLFNFLVGEKCNFNWAQLTDLTDITKIHVPTNFKHNPNLQIYHFCGWAGNMYTKYQRMINFLNNNQITIPSII